MTLDANTSFDIETLAAGYAAGAFSPRDAIDEVLRRIDAAGDDRVWIDRASRETLLERVQTIEEVRARAHVCPCSASRLRSRTTST